MGADVADDLHIKGDNPARCVEAEPALGDAVAALIIGQTTFVALARPFHRTAHDSGGPEHAQLLGVAVDARAEPPAHIGGYDAQALHGQVHRRADAAAQAMHALTAGDQQIVARRSIILAQSRARLHLRGHGALAAKDPLDHMGGASKGLRKAGAVVHIRFNGEIAGHIVPDLRRAGLEGLGAIDDGGQDLVGHLHGFGGVAGLFARFRHHHGDGLAGKARLVDGEGDMGLVMHQMAHARHESRARPLHRIGGDGALDEAAETRRRIIRAAQHRQHAGHGAGWSRIDALDEGMGVGRAHEGGEDLAGQGHIVGKTACAAQQPEILETRQGPPDPWSASASVFLSPVQLASPLLHLRLWAV